MNWTNPVGPPLIYLSFDSSQVSDDDPFLLDEAETARCVEVCRAHLIEGAPAHVAEELAHAWIAVVGETLLQRQKGPSTCDVHMPHCVLYSN